MSRAKNEMLLQENVLRMFRHPTYADDDVTTADGPIDNMKITSLDQSHVMQSTTSIAIRLYPILHRPYGASKENTLGRTSNINGMMTSCNLEGRTIMFGKQSMDQYYRTMVTPTCSNREQSWGAWKSNINERKNDNVIISKRKSGYSK